MDDFCSRDPALKDQRRKLISGLLIDTTFREADFAKFYQDVEAAKTSYEKVVQWCTGEFAEGNEKLLGSAHFSLGSLLLEMNKREEARVQLEKALTI